MKKNKFPKFYKILFSALTFMLIINCSDDESTAVVTQGTPSLTAIGDFTNFGSVEVLNNSTSQSIEVKGVNLISDLTLETSSSFEVSIDDVNFSNEIVINKSDANAGNTTVYVRFSPSGNAVGAISGSLTLENAQASNVTMSLFGTGVNITPVIIVNGTITSFGEVNVSQNSDAQTVTVNGNNLQSDITVTTTSSFEVSLDNLTFANSLQIPVANVNDNTLIYVRFVADTVGVTTGTITFSNTDAADVVLDLEGIGLPVVHNYVTFDDQGLANGSGFTRFLSQTFNLHSDISNIEQIKMFVQIDCLASGCDDWDRFANVKVRDVATGNWFEIGRYVTPYWVGTQQLERGLEFDVTDFKGLLTGTTELRIFIENWSSKPDLLTVEFDYIEGTPDYPFYAVSEVLGYHGSSINAVPYGVDHDWDLDKQVNIPSNAESTHLRTIISGWGHATPSDGSRPCAEWCFRTHDVKINGSNMFSHFLGPIGCASNPINNQSPGNWVPDRAGWCPGMAVPNRIDAFSSTMAGSTFTFEYDYEDWVNDMVNGDAFYATSTYVVVKSNSPITAPIVTD